MIQKAFLFGLLLAVILPDALRASEDPIPNPNIDMPAHLEASQKAAKLRETHRVSEPDFLRMIQDPNTVLLDARSRAKFAELHIAGAVNLPFPDFTASDLEALIPNPGTRILIYCNNNFLNALEAFATKSAPASLNINTFETLYIYGYRNIYELGPLIDIHETILPLEGSLAPKYRR